MPSQASILQLFDTMKKAIKYFGIVILIMMAFGSVAGVIQGTIHPLLAIFTIGFMYLILVEFYFTLCFLFWFDELADRFDKKAGARIVPRERFTWELLTCWHGPTPQATRWRRIYNIMGIFAVLNLCSIFIYGLLIYFVLGALGSSSGGSGSSDGSGQEETPSQNRHCFNCRWGSVDGCAVGGGNRAGVGGSCSRWEADR